MTDEMKPKIDCETCLWAQRSGGCMRWGCEYVDKHEAYDAWKNAKDRIYIPDGYKVEKLGDKNRAKDINVPDKGEIITHIPVIKLYDTNDGFYRCSNCHRVIDSGYNFCPSCGARLEWE